MKKPKDNLHFDYRDPRTEKELSFPVRVSIIILSSLILWAMIIMGAIKLMDFFG